MIGNTTVSGISGTDPKTEKEKLNPKMFGDISEDYWMYKELYEMKNLNIISGDSDGNFNPDLPIKREEFAKLLCGVFNLEMKDGNTDFNDVVSGSWYEHYVKLAASNGIIYGYEDGSFGVGKNITRQDICVMVYRALDTSAEDPDVATFSFKDANEISGYAESAINYMYVTGIISGYEDFSFRPKDECTRVHAARILHQVLNRARGVDTKEAE